MNNTKLERRDLKSPDLAEIRKNSRSDSDRAKNYLKEALDKIGYYKYNEKPRQICIELCKDMRVEGIFSGSDTRVIVSGILHYVANRIFGHGLTVEEVVEVLGISKVSVTKGNKIVSKFLHNHNSIITSMLTSETSSMI